MILKKIITKNVRIELLGVFGLMHVPDVVAPARENSDSSSRTFRNAKRKKGELAEVIGISPLKGCQIFRIENPERCHALYHFAPLGQGVLEMAKKGNS